MGGCSGEDLELLSCACPLLEVLSVTLSDKLTELKIIDPSPALKRLEIKYCCNLTSVEIRDANLVCLMYHGRWLQQFVLKNVPHLIEMHLGGGIVKCLKDFRLMLSSHLAQLEKLAIYTPRNKFFLRVEICENMHAEATGRQVFGRQNP